MNNKICSIYCIAAILILVVLSGCKEDPGQVGSRFIDPDANVSTNSFELEDFELHSDPSYSGNLRHMAIGRYNDPLFGMIDAIGYIRPSIIQSNLEFVVSSDEMRLRLQFTGEIYGDTTAVANFSIYEISDLWRGNEVKYRDVINFDTATKLGEFSVSGEQTVLVDLDDDWVSRYNQFLINDDPDRDAVYRAEFPGLAIVSDDPEGSKILFARIITASDDQTVTADISGFSVERPITDESFFQTSLDWGSTLTRSDIVQSGPESVAVFNTLENFIAFDIELNETNLGSKSLANVELILFENRSLLQQSLPVNHTRPSIESMRIHILNSETDLAEQIFTTAPDFVAFRDSIDHSFRFPITNFANDSLFDTADEGKFFLTIQTTNGIFFSTVIYNASAVENRRPRINITSVSTNN